MRSGGWAPLQGSLSRARSSKRCCWDGVGPAANSCEWAHLWCPASQHPILDSCFVRTSLLMTTF